MTAVTRAAARMGNVCVSLDLVDLTAVCPTALETAATRANVSMASVFVILVSPDQTALLKHVPKIAAAMAGA